MVGLRIGLVYSAALRQAGGDVQWAQDATQAVFSDLAVKAKSLCRHEALVGWLYTSTRYAIAKMARAEGRRRKREQEAFSMQQDLAPDDSEIPAERLRPLLDEALHELPETDRQALLLRFFAGRSLAELGQSLGLSETAAQKRVERALLKLKEILAKRGLSSTAVAIGVALGQEAFAVTVPAGLAAMVSGGAFAAASAAASGVGIVSFLTAPMTVAAGLSGAVLAVAVGLVAYENRSLRSDSAEGRSGSVVAAGPSGPVRVAGTSKSDSLAAETGETDDPRAPEATPIVRKPPTPAGTSSFSPEVVQPVSGHPSAERTLVVLPLGPDNLPAALRVFDPVQLDQRPVPASRLSPNYPAEMRRRRISGEVLVDFIVDADGRVHHAVAVKSSRSEFERAAVEAVSAWRFKPGTKTGRAVSTHLQLPIFFTLDSHD